MSSHANKNIGRIARLLAIAAVLLFPLAASAAQDKTLRAPARPPAPADVVSYLTWCKDAR